MAGTSAVKPPRASGSRTYVGFMRKKPVVVITGASSGIGRATALRFARDHAHLVLVSRRLDALQQLAAECEQQGARASAVAADTTDADAVDRAAEVAAEEYGRVDVWVNAAAVSSYGLTQDIPLHEFRRVLDVNIMGYVHGCRSALRMMKPQREGVIVNIASILGEIQQPYTAPYGMSKAAVRALGVTLRSELALEKLDKVHVVTLLPPTIDTPFYAHAGNHTGRQLVALPPVYPAELVATAVHTAAAHPGKHERVLGALGRELVRLHRKHPVEAEWQLAVQTEASNFSPHSADDTEGALFTPPVGEARVSGGWGGRSRRNGRVLLALVGAAAVSVVILARKQRN